MRAIRYHRYGEPAAVVAVDDLPAATPGRGEVVIALEAAPIHLADIKNITGQPWFQAPLPAIPGYEGVGRISKIGPDVKTLSVGDRVFLPTGLGTWREEFPAMADGLWRAPEALPAEQLALLPINLQTAWLMLTEGKPVQPGDWVIQNAANSNVGYYLIRLAAELGLRTINVVRREAAVADVLAAGGDIALVDGEDLPDRVLAVSENVRLGIDAVGGTATARLAACLGYEAQLLNYGFLTGDACTLSAQQMMFRQLRFRGFFTKATLGRMSQAGIDAMRDRLTAFIEKDRPQARIAGVYAFAQVHEALAHAARVGSARAGKVILRP